MPPEQGAPQPSHSEVPDAAQDEGTPPPPPLTPRDLRPEHFPTTASNDGRIAWIVAFIMCIPFPGLSAIAGYIVMIVVGRGQRGKNPVARAKGRRASNFAIASLATILVFIPVFTTLILLEDYAGVDPSTLEPFMMIAAPFGIWGFIIGPLTAFVIAIIAATDHVSELEATKIYARAGW